MYTLIKNALIACCYADKDASVIAKRLARRKDPIMALNQYLSA